MPVALLALSVFHTFVYDFFFQQSSTGHKSAEEIMGNCMENERMRVDAF